MSIYQFLWMSVSSSILAPKTKYRRIRISKQCFRGYTLTHTDRRLVEHYCIALISLDSQSIRIFHLTHYRFRKLKKSHEMYFLTTSWLPAYLLPNTRLLFSFPFIFSHSHLYSQLPQPQPHCPDESMKGKEMDWMENTCQVHAHTPSYCATKIFFITRNGLRLTTTSPNICIRSSCMQDITKARKSWANNKPPFNSPLWLVLSLTNVQIE